MSLYDQRGVSAQKEEVHAAVKNLNQGLYPYSFCKMYPDDDGNPYMASVSHADGAGTKSILAYLYWRETGDASVWRGIAQDAMVMNLDDLLCVGITDNISYSSTIDRNKNLITGKVISEIIDGSKAFIDLMKTYDVNIKFKGGETADVGDAVRTITVNGTMNAKISRFDVITNQRIQAGDVIVGFASFGKADYESDYNSGLASNGLTSARHDVLSKYYEEQYPESYDPATPSDVRFVGQHKLTDMIALSPHDDTPLLLGKARQAPPTVNYTGKKIEIAQLLLSPTRTYAPIIHMLMKYNARAIHGMVHCSGGGQTKCMKYLPKNLAVEKTDLFRTPDVFQLIQQGSNASQKEMHEVFNMGHRLEVFTGADQADTIIRAANAFGVQAKVIGNVKDAVDGEPRLTIKPYGSENVLTYDL